MALWYRAETVCCMYYQCSEAILASGRPDSDPHWDDFGQHPAEPKRSFDGFVVVTPEYNHSTSGVLKNAMDYLFVEWNNKAVGFVSYGAHGGVRAVEHLRVMAGELMMADVRAQVVLSFATDFENHRHFRPGDHNLPALNTMLDQVVAWSESLAPLRAQQQVAA